MSTDITVTETDILDEIVAEVGDPNGTMALIAQTLWSIYAVQAAIRTDLQRLYTKRGVLDARLAEEQSSVDFKADTLSVFRSQLFTHLQQMRVDCQAEIVRVEAIARSARAPSAGALTAITPQTPPFPDSPDANDPLYRGTPYPRLSRW